MPPAPPPPARAGAPPPAAEQLAAAARGRVNGLKQEFPSDGILAEESVDTERRLSKSRVWMVDPIDGTNGFIDGNGDFAVQIGLVEDGAPVVAVVYIPLSRVLYRAVIGEGAL